MSIEPVEYYRAVCDACGGDFADLSEYTAWSTREGAIEDAKYAEALVEGDLVICEKCLNRHRADFSDEEWDALADKTPEAIARLQAWVDAALVARASDAKP